MEISLQRAASRAPMILVALGLFLISSSLIAVTWSGLKQQREILDRNMLLTAGALLRSIQPIIQRAIRLQSPLRPGRFDARAMELFQSMVQGGDVRYMAVITSAGEILLSSIGEGGHEIILPSGALESLESRGSWHGVVRGPKSEMLLMGLRNRAGSVDIGVNDMPLSGFPERPEKTFLLLGMGMDAYLAQYQDFRTAALVQTGYILAAAVVLFGLSYGILRRREEGARLAALERFHSKLLDTMPDGLLAVDGDGYVRAANPAAHAILGAEPGTLVGAVWERVVPALATMNGHGGDWTQVESEGKKLELLKRKVGDPEAPEQLILVRDRTAMKDLEERLAGAQRLAAVGRMAAGVAHEIRNPLSSLRGFAQLFATKFAGVKPEEEYARTMVREADRLNKVVSDMLFLARPRSLTPGEIELAPLAEELARLVSFDLRQHHATLDVRLETPRLKADGDSLKQALLNLLMNAIAALPAEGGRIELRAAAQGAGVRLSVTDNGRGMTEDEREHALEPFFTTRASGTGLGLAIVEAIVREHGGMIEIDSTPGHGTTVSLILLA